MTHFGRLDSMIVENITTLNIQKCVDGMFRDGLGLSTIELCISRSKKTIQRGYRSV